MVITTLPSRTSRAPCQRPLLHSPYGTAMSAPFGSEHSPSFRACGVGGRHETTIVSPCSLCTVCGVGGPLKTTIVSPSPLDRCGRPLFDVWVLPEEYGRDDWFDSGHVHASWILRSILVLLSCAHLFFQRSRQTSESLFTFFVLKVDSDLEVDSRPALWCCNFTARGSVFNAPDNAGNPTIR